jgi:serine/threonine protein kinase
MVISRLLILVFRRVKLLVGKKYYQTVCGTPEYLAPEVLKKAAYNKSVDFWNFGCLVYELMVGQSPFYSSEDDFRKLYMKISQGLYEIPKDISPNAADLIQKLLIVDPTQRLGCNGVQEIREHPFFSNINWGDLLRNNKKGPLNVTYAKDEMKLRALNVNLDELISDDKTIELDNFSFNEN